MTTFGDLTLDELRAELRVLVAYADTAERPKPSRINGPDHPMPGQQWDVEGRNRLRNREWDDWHVIALDDPEVADCVYVSTPDGFAEEDYMALRVTRARQLAMALLAACDRAEHLRAGVPRLADRRRTREAS